MICMVLPAYNEEASIEILLNKIKDLFNKENIDFKVIIVNDGSSDLTPGILDKFAEHNNQFIIIHHKNNKGLGEAMKTGLKASLEHLGKEDIVITMDADNTHDPSLMLDMIHKIKTENKNLVIASRFTNGGKEIGVSLKRKILSRGASLFFKIFMPIKHVNDYSSGYRAYKGELLERAFNVYGDKIIEAKGFECMVELLAKLSRLSLQPAEVPLILRYDFKATPSKMNISSTIKGYFGAINRAKNFPIKD